MAGQRQTATAKARARARDAKTLLDAERVEREKKIEDAATDFYVAEDLRTAALAKVAEHETAMGRAITVLVGEGESVERIATLCGIEQAEVRRLRRRGDDAPSSDEGQATPSEGPVEAAPAGSDVELAVDGDRRTA